MRSNELTPKQKARAVASGRIVDGKHVTFDQLRELISSYEG